MDKELVTSLESLERLIKNNYTNLESKMSKLETDIKEDIEKLDRSISSIQKDWKYDHDKLLKVESAIRNQEKDLDKFQQQEKIYGLKTNKEIEVLRTIVQSVNISYGKIIGICSGMGIVIGLIVGVVIKIL